MGTWARTWGKIRDRLIDMFLSRKYIGLMTLVGLYLFTEGFPAEYVRDGVIIYMAANVLQYGAEKWFGGRPNTQGPDSAP